MSTPRTFTTFFAVGGGTVIVYADRVSKVERNNTAGRSQWTRIYLNNGTCIESGEDEATINSKYQAAIS